MEEKKCYLSDFQIIRPKHTSKQKDGLEWLANAYFQARKHETQISKMSDNNDLSPSSFYRFLNRFGCNEEKIQTRGHELPDFLHTDWEKMLVYSLTQSSNGEGLKKRMDFYEESVGEIFQKFYHETKTSPDHIFHVSCTGYVSPSPAQTLVSQKNWGKQTAVTHLYHMGCYASLPAVRLAQAQLLSHSDNSHPKIDIVHTELCTLQLNPGNHTPEQMVVHSLFADGFIKYSLTDSLTQNSTPASLPARQGLYKKGIKVIRVLEHIIPESRDDMRWNFDDSCLQMTLSTRIPHLIKENVKSFVNELIAHAKKVGYRTDSENIDFAIHPGGPKIIQLIKDELKLTNTQVEVSEMVLRECGNMSSATLPHIWEKMLRQENKHDKLLVSLAFGPGLTIAGMIGQII